MDTPIENSPRGDDLLAAARAGDAAAFWRLAESYRPHLQGVAAQMLGHELGGKADASDVVQQGLCVAFEQIAQFQGQDAEQWQGWVLAIVRNHARKVMRYWHQRKRDVRREQPLAAGSSNQGGLAVGSSSPSRRAIRREQAVRLLSAIERLPLHYREVILLRNFEDLSYPEVAIRMNRTEDAVRQLWERAVRRLRKEWGDET